MCLHLTTLVHLPHTIIYHANNVCCTTYVYTYRLICSWQLVHNYSLVGFATKTCYFVILFHPQKVPCSVSRCKHADTEDLEQQFSTIVKPSTQGTLALTLMCDTHVHNHSRVQDSVADLQLGPQGLDLKPHPQDCLNGLQHLLPAMEVVCE